MKAQQRASEQEYSRPFAPELLRASARSDQSERFNALGQYAKPSVIAMLIESTESFQASAAIEIRRGSNEVTESDYARLSVATRTKLRILQEHGVLRLCAWPASEKRAPQQGE